MFRARWSVATALAVAVAAASPAAVSRAERILVAPSASLGLPLGPTASLATAISLDRGGLDNRSEPALILDGGLGVGGWRLSAGYGHAAYGDSEILWGTELVGVRATILKTWGRPFNARARETYVGALAVLRIISNHDEVGVGVDFGALYRIDGPTDHGRLMPYVAIDAGRFFAF
ncbi:MAG TPA: hypothetical protein VFU59_08205 [Candidatus Eisenbacteria bacterium]|nr:hypothetical protein [Candidatus Eisenbacteria bacterium]